MAIDTQCFRLIITAACSGVDFSSCLTFGRQQYYPRKKHVLTALSDSALDVNHEEIASIKSDFCEPFLQALGAETVDSMDISDYQSATILHELNQPVPAEHHGKYSVVIDGGTTEHVYNFPEAMHNAMKLLEVGGHFISMVTGNNFSGHGFYQISPELYFRLFSPENGFETRGVFLAGEHPGRPFYLVSDPAAIKGRVEFKSFERLYVGVVARKIADSGGALVTPLQSDYQELWKSKMSPVGKLAREFNRMILHTRTFFGLLFNLAWQSRGIRRLSGAALYNCLSQKSTGR